LLFSVSQCSSCFSIPRYNPDMDCRPGCGACCIVISISSPIPGMPLGKPAGVRCVQLSEDNLCRLFGKPERPLVCIRLTPSQEMCGNNVEEALEWLFALEQSTKPEVVD
jgi:uncharacterized protein